MRAAPLRLPEPLAGPLRRIAAWRGWPRLRLPIACVCFAGGLVGLTLPVWSGWWTGHVQAQKARAFHHELTHATLAVPASTVAPAASVTVPVAPSTPVASAASAALPAAPSSTAAAGPADVPAGDPLAELRIPSIGVDTLVLEGLTYDPSVWSQLLREGPGHVQGTALPGQPGNAVIFGHLNIWGAVFMRLAELRPGAEATLTTTWGTFTYKVTGSELIGANETDAVAAHHTGPATLQLVTCDGLLEQSRRVVEAALVQGTGSKA